MAIISGLVRGAWRFAVLIVFTGMLALNVASLTWAGAATLISGVLARAGVETVIGGAEAKLAASERKLARAERDLSKANSRLAAKNRELVKVRSKLARSEARMGRITKGAEEQKRVVQRLTSRIARRTEIGAARNLGSMFGEAVPVYGIAVIVGATGWEIADACLTMQDMEELNRAVGISSTEVDRETVCGLQVPTVDEVKENLPDLGW